MTILMKMMKMMKIKMMMMKKVMKMKSTTEILHSNQNIKVIDKVW